jgi:hypothetical protein
MAEKMNLIHVIFGRNKLLAYFGLLFLLHSIILIIAMPFNTVEVLGINALVKPLKFSISIWIFCWTIGMLVFYFNDTKSVHRLTIVIIVTMIYEQAVITIQALNGQLSHFNQSSPINIVLYALMGFFITTMTLYILWLNIKFHRQKDDLPKHLKIAIVWAIYLFVFSALMGGVISSLKSHTVGGEMGAEGLRFLNWSTKFGDLRVGHFFGIHALQIIPVIAIFCEKTRINQKFLKSAIVIFSTIFTAFVVGTFIQAFLKQPFLN